MPHACIAASHGVASATCMMPVLYSASVTTVRAVSQADVDDLLVQPVLLDPHARPGVVVGGGEVVARLFRDQEGRDDVLVEAEEVDLGLALGPEALAYRWPAASRTISSRFVRGTRRMRRDARSAQCSWL
jgi:hypothetical protein